MHLTHDTLAALYETVRTLPPYSGWGLPEADEVEFHVAGFRDKHGDYSARPHVLRVSRHSTGHIGRALEVVAHETLHMAQAVLGIAPKHDWHDIGFMEAHVKLVNANTGKTAIMAVVHPGGGSAYALSYSVQKIVEALEGGEKPAVSLYGHYHKLWSGTIRNVWVLCTGCTQDQTVFTRNKIKQEVHVGGALVGLEQDPETGAIIGFAPKLMRYFVKGFYDNRWSKAGQPAMPERRIA